MTAGAVRDPLDACGCCETEPVQAPRFNRPGLPSIAYRAGTHATFFRRMIARLNREAVETTSGLARPLTGLRTRDSADLAIALLDSWATVADVLCFYQERIANEGFVRTATERRSVLELARSIGYELRPGVAASTFLAFTAEPSDAGPGRATVPKGTKVQSVPGQGETSQTFESMEDLEARTEFNAMRPARTEPWLPWRGDTHVFLKGVQTGLKAGDGILFIGKERETKSKNKNWDFRRVVTVTPHPAPDREGYTRVTWDKPLGWHRGGKRVDPPDRRWMKFYAFRLRASLFGHNAPDWKTIPPDVRSEYSVGARGTPTDWPHLPLTSDDTVDMDAVYPQIVPDSWVVLSKVDWEEVYRVTATEEHNVTDFTFAAKTTQLTLSGKMLLKKFANNRRDVFVFAQSERFEFADSPVPDPVEGDEILFDRLVDGLREGQKIAVAGEEDESGEFVKEIATIHHVETVPGRTRIGLERPLENRYQRDSVAVNANVVLATHGETVQAEVLGSGDASTSNQRFELKRRPLTYMSAPTAEGVESSLRVRLDDVLWPEAPSLFALDDRGRNCIVRIDDDGRTVVLFGNGRRSARLPSGLENVKGTYRFGSGPEGEVAGGRLTLIPMRPLGVREVTNPVAATGSAPPESLENARINAPRHVLTLGRIVSLQDYGDFVRTFPGIGKALATVLWNGENRFVHITAATTMGTPLARESDLYENLWDALDAHREPRESFLLNGHAPRTFSLGAKVLVDARHRVDHVFDAVRSALLAAFSFERREFGGGVTAAETVATIQAVAGVRAVDLDRLARDDELPAAGASRVPAVLEARPARFDGSTFLPAELLLLNPDGIWLSEMEP